LTGQRRADHTRQQAPDQQLPIDADVPDPGAKGDHQTGADDEQGSDADQSFGDPVGRAQTAAEEESIGGKGILAAQDEEDSAEDHRRDDGGQRGDQRQKASGHERTACHAAAP
jgi:hypothetical protein